MSIQIMANGLTLSVVSVKHVGKSPSHRSESGFIDVMCLHKQTVFYIQVYNFTHRLLETKFIPEFFHIDTQYTPNLIISTTTLLTYVVCLILCFYKNQ